MASGEKGDVGQIGQAGPQGFTGTKGEQGFKGEKGDQGMDGPPGSQGPQGETGTCPATCQSVQGPPGLQGVPGPAGARGLPGVQGPMGLKGLTGDKGDMGKPGEPGKNGTKGDQGEKGVCMCKDGVNGTNGSPGVSGIKGDKGDTGAMGVQGPIGPKGNEGHMGIMGPPGPCSPAIQSAFSAAVNQSFPAPNWPIAFPVIITNQQGHFNSIMGIYMAPINGTYVFTYNLAVATKPLTVGLFVNFNPVVRNTEVYSRSSTSQTIVLNLKSFDRVWLQVKNDLTNGIYTDMESSSTFSGYLLHPDSCEMPFGRMFVPEYHYKPGDFTWEDPSNKTTTAPPQH
ncbi:otolin-1 [Perca fluviatilis]|uniref:otolin-1 n=1 Tax=Perca fluviatilis TaxID=8168 RepID=UPI0019649BCB|nr:otolin-1 [Perca fluviatilis]